jgi:hypothetical protein
MCHYEIRWLRLSKAIAFFRLRGSVQESLGELDGEKLIEEQARDYLFLPPPLFAMPLMC